MTIHNDCPAPSPNTPLTLTLLCHSVHGRACLSLLLLLLLLLMPPATAQLQNTLPPPPQDPFARLKFDKTMAVVLVILVVVFFILGFVSIYTRQCAERRIRARLDLSIPIIGVNVGGSRRQPSRGLDPEIIDTFPTFVYSTVKGLKIGRATLECAVCLNEFRDDETLRLIPKCSHVFHPDCIDVWLATHSTCPVCRANLAPKPGDMSSVAIQIQDPGGSGSHQPDPEACLDDPNDINRAVDDGGNRIVAESPRANLDEQNHPVRSRSTGFGMKSLFPRSHSTGHSLIRPGENCDRFTLRLPEQVRNQLVNSVSTLSRTKSCGVMLQRESSGRRGYRTRSMGRNYRQYEWFGRENRPDRWGLTWTPPFVGRTGSRRSTKEANKASGIMDEVDVEGRSSDRLFFPRSED